MPTLHPASRTGLRGLRIAAALLLATGSAGCLTRLDLSPCRSNDDCGVGGFCFKPSSREAGFCLPMPDAPDAGPPADGGTTIPPGSTIREVEAPSVRLNDRPESAEPIDAPRPFALAGTIGADDGFTGDVDCYRVSLGAGDHLDIVARPTPASPARLRLSVRGLEGATGGYRVRTAIDPASATAHREIITPAEGSYAICVEDARNASGASPRVGGLDHTYEIEVRDAQPVRNAVAQGSGTISATVDGGGRLPYFRIDVPSAPMAFVARTRSTAVDTALALLTGEGRRRQLLRFHEDLDRATNQLDARVAEILPVGTYFLAVDLHTLGAPVSLDLDLTFVDTGTEHEPNDTLHSAFPIPVTDTPLEGGIGAPVGGNADVDVYLVRPKLGSYLVVRAEATGALLPRLTLLDAAGHEIARQPNLARAGTAALDWLVPADGDWFVRVEDVRNAAGEGPVGGADFGYRLRFEEAVRAPTVLGTLAAPDLVRTGEQIPTAGAGGWYRLTTPAGPHLAVVSGTAEGTTWSPQVRLFAESGLGRLDDSDGPALRKYVEAGDYWLGVHDAESRGGLAYTLRARIEALTPEVEPNQTASSTQTLPLPVRVRGEVRGIDADLYAVDLPAGVSLRVETLSGSLQDRAVDTVLEILDPSGRVLASNDDGDRPPFSKIAGFAVPRRGRYIVRVTAKNDGGGFYLLLVDTDACVSPADTVAPATGTLVLNEILYRPAAGAAGAAGDANGDGTTNASQDSFVEVLNTSAQSLDLGGVSLRDGNSACDPSGEHRLFTFPCGTRLPPGRAAVVFGGGAPYGTFGLSRTFVSSSPDRCRLHLDPTGDTLRLVGRDGADLASFTYPAAGACDGASCTCDGASCARDPDGTGAFSVSGQMGTAAFTPGTARDGSPFAGSTPAANDLCENAQVLPAGQQVSANGTGATDSARASCGPDSPELVYRLDLTATSDVQVNAPGATALSLLDACPRAGGVELSCAATDSLTVPELLGDPQAPRSYYLFVEAPGPVTVGWTATAPVAPAPGDRCHLGPLLTVPESRAGQTTAGATDDYRPPLGCGMLPSALPGPDVAYRLRLGRAERVRIEVTPDGLFDPAVYVVSACGSVETECLAAVDLGASGEPEVLTFTAPLAGDYFVIVDSYAPFEQGTFTLSVQP